MFVVGVFFLNRCSLSSTHLIPHAVCETSTGIKYSPNCASKQDCITNEECGGAPLNLIICLSLCKLCLEFRSMVLQDLEYQNDVRQ